VQSTWSAQGFCPEAVAASSPLSSSAAAAASPLLSPPPAGSEEIVYASVDVAGLRSGRTHTTTGDSYRRPFDYAPLCFRDAANGTAAANNSSSASSSVSSTPLSSPSPSMSLASSAPQELVIALLQMRPNTTFVPRDHTNELVAKAETFIRRAAAAGADVALLPEMWSVGYEALFPCEPNNACNNTASLLEWMRLATPLGGGYIAHFRSLARELDMAIAATYMEAITGPGGEPWPPRNSVALIDRHGNVVYNYAKVHTCQFSGLEALHSGGRTVLSGVLDTKTCGNVRVASIICFDREQIEAARMATLGGAEVLLVPNACWLDNATLDHFAVRGMENAASVAMTNYADVPQWRDATNGRSVAYDHLGNTLVVAQGEEDMYLARVDVAALRAHRATPFASALVGSANVPRAELCDLPRRPEFGGAGALGRMSVPL
jgi:predicted amidohydrolase